ncbi:MAG: OmpA family protein [Gammaproteobacteria bacterium]
MSRFLLLLVGLLLLAALLFHCLTTRPAQIQADVRACVEGRMQTAGLDGVAVTVDGRDVRLTGDVPDEAAKTRAGELADDDCGARVVANEISLAAPEPYRASLCIDRSGLRATGSLPDEATRKRYRRIAEERLGSVAIDADISYRPDIPEGFDRLMTTVFAELAQMDRGCVEIVDTNVSVSGEVRSAAARDRLVADMNAAAGGNFTVTYDVSVPALSASASRCQEALAELLAPGEQVLFDFDSAELHAEGRALLDSAEEIWQTCPEISLIVAGHTDSEGDAEYNRKLSEQRANAVVEYLVAQGVDRSKLTPIGYGEAQPQATNETEEGRALNRRMEFRVRENAQ